MSSALARPEKPAEDLRSSLVEPGIGETIYDLACRIYPICRSITGPEVRETLGILAGHLPLEVREVPMGTTVFAGPFRPSGRFAALHSEYPGEKNVRQPSAFQPPSVKRHADAVTPENLDQVITFAAKDGVRIAPQ
jgi:hypothetical protein